MIAKFQQVQEDKAISALDSALADVDAMGATGEGGSSSLGARNSQKRR